MAEAWATHFFETRFVMADVRSAGVVAIDILGDPAAARDFDRHPFSRAAAFAVEVTKEHGLDLSGHRTRRLTAGMIDWADAVVVMEPRHATHAAALASHAGSKIQGLWIHADGDLSDIWDPQGRSLDDYRASCTLIRDAVERFVAAHLAARRER